LQNKKGILSQEENLEEMEIKEENKYIKFSNEKNVFFNSQKIFLKNLIILAPM